jgi:hypothetical protein
VKFAADPEHNRLVPRALNLQHGSRCGERNCQTS